MCSNFRFGLGPCEYHQNITRTSLWQLWPMPNHPWELKPFQHPWPQKRFWMRASSQKQTLKMRPLHHREFLKRSPQGRDDTRWQHQRSLVKSFKAQEEFAQAYMKIVNMKCRLFTTCNIMQMGVAQSSLVPERQGFLLKILQFQFGMSPNLGHKVIKWPMKACWPVWKSARPSCRTASPKGAW